MKMFNQLTPGQQTLAIEQALNFNLKLVCEGDLGLHDDLQARVVEAARRADEMQTPWFMSEYVMDTCSEELAQLARLDAERALYREPHDFVMDEPQEIT